LNPDYFHFFLDRVVQNLAPGYTLIIVFSGIAEEISSLREIHLLNRAMKGVYLVKLHRPSEK